jgi:hypothetical protein
LPNLLAAATRVGDVNELEPFETKNLFDPGVLLEAVDKFENSSSPLTSELLTKSGIDLAFVRKHAQTVIANLNDDFPWPHRLKRLADNYCGDYTDLLSREVMEAAKEKTPHQHRAYVTDPKNNESVSTIVAIARDHLRTMPVFASFCAVFYVRGTFPTRVTIIPRAWLSSHARGYRPTRVFFVLLYCHVPQRLFTVPTAVRWKRGLVEGKQGSASVQPVHEVCHGAG